LPARWINPEKSTGNLAPGQTLFGEPIAEVIEGRAYSWDAELERQRALVNARFYSPPAPRSTASFVRRSIRRCS
jgi:hypothetical protein